MLDFTCMHTLFSTIRKKKKKEIEDYIAENYSFYILSSFSVFLYFCTKILMWFWLGQNITSFCKESFSVISVMF